MFVASLHQAITEVLPGRVEFYESWLTSGGFRASRVSLAAIRAVLSFLRQDGAGYDAVMQRAGELTASWTYQGMSVLRRGWLRALPPWARYRVVCRIARRLARETWLETRASVRWKNGTGTLAIQTSLFCDVRGTAPASLCRYYAAVLEALTREAGLDAGVRVEACSACGDQRCAVVVTPAATSRAMSLAAPLWFVACALWAGIAHAQGTAPLPAARQRVLVMPFDNASQTARLSWLGEGSAILLADALLAAGADAITRDERLRAFERLQVPPLATLSRATVVRVGELVGAADIVVGSMALDGDMLVVKARRLRLESGRLDAEVTERGRLGDLFATYDRLAADLWRRAPAPEAPPQDVVPRGLEPAAFEHYVKGLLAETPAAQIQFLRLALEAHPGFDAARVGLWQAQTAAGDHRAALAAVAPVPDGSPFGIEARFLASLSHGRLGEYAEAFEMLSALQQRAPSAVFQNNLGVVRLRGTALPAELGRPVSYFGQARTLDSLDPDYVFNLGYAYWLDGDPQAAAFWLRESVRLNPADGGAHAMLAQALHAAGQTSEGARELALSKHLSSAFDGIVLKIGSSGPPPRGMERLKETLERPRAERIDAAFEMVGQRDQRELALFYLERGRRLFEQENDREAEPELTRARYLAPYEPEAHLLLGRIYVRTGRMRDAIDAFKISLWSEESVAAHLALAECYLAGKNEAAALAEAERALALDPRSTHAQQLIARLK